MAGFTSEYKTEKAVYNANDFLLWTANDQLEITPKFQRRSVWRTPARSYFIDTMLRGMTVPPLYMRWTQNKVRTKTIREVVDGQQRVRSVLEFIKPDGYRLSKSLKNAPWAGKKFAQLTPAEQERIKDFGFSTELFSGLSDKQILEVFCRLNLNGIQLNKQELRNGKFFGLFKQTSYDLAHSYLEFWHNHNVFSHLNIARMAEVELTSELLIAGNEGMQDKKKSIDDFYELWEDSYPNQSRDEKRFGEVMEAISNTFEGDGLAETAFRKPPLFYTLYCVLYHFMFGLPKVQRASPRKKLSADERTSLREAIIHLSEKILQFKDPNAEPIEKKYTNFVQACLRQTDNIQPRKARFDSLYAEAF